MRSINSHTIRFPTILGLGLLTAGLVLGVILINTRQILESKANQSTVPQDIKVTNISGTSASISWQTENSVTGFIKIGINSDLNQTAKDDRDKAGSKNHQLHFITLNNLSPDTTYYYKIISGSQTHPPGEPLLFKTSATPLIVDRQPIIGTVLDTTLQPVEEALVILEIDGAQTLSAVTKMAGNFILPLTVIRTTDLKENYSLQGSGISAKLTITDGRRTSQAAFQLPAKNTILPPIVLGQDIDLTTKTASPSAAISRYDLNGDGVTNSLDLGIILKNYGGNPKDKRADLNGDGVVDQKDVAILNKFIPRVSPR